MWTDQLQGLGRCLSDLLLSFTGSTLFRMGLLTIRVSDTEAVVWWYSACLVCVRPWVQALVLG